MTVFFIDYSESAAKVRDSLPPDRREVLENGMRKIASDPLLPGSSPVREDQNIREMFLDGYMLVQYAILDGLVTVMALKVADLH